MRMPLLILVAACLLPPAAGFGAQDGKDALPSRKRETPGPPPFRFLTHHLFSAEMGLMGSNLPDHNARTLRRANLRLLAWDDWFLDTLYEEDLLYGDTLEQVNHTFDYVRLGRSFGLLDAFLFWNHTCNNAVAGLGLNDMHWNDIGLELSTDARPGADREPGWRIRARWGAAFMLSACDYRWIAEAETQFREGAAGEGSVFGRIRVKVRADPCRVVLSPLVEVGFTLPLNAFLVLEPFARMERRQDERGYRTDPDTWWLVGMRLVRRTPRRAEGADALPDGFLRPWLAVKIGYALRLLQKDLGYMSRSAFRLRSSDIAPGFRAEFDAVTGINTPPDDMFPNYVTYALSPAATLDLASLTWRVFYRYRERRAVGHHWEEPAYKCLHATGIRVEPRRPDPGLEALRPFPERFRWGCSATAYPATRAFPFRASVAGSVRVFLFELRNSPLTFAAWTRHFFGPHNLSVTGLACEFSVAWPGTAGRFRVYLRLEHAYDPFRFGRGDHYFLGFEFGY